MPPPHYYDQWPNGGRINGVPLYTLVEGISLFSLLYGYSDFMFKTWLFGLSTLKRGYV